MSLFYNCFRLLFPDEPPSVIDPPDPGGDGCPECGGGGDDGGCTGPDCDGTDPCDEILKLYTCGDCNDQGCCQNRQFEEKSISRWVSENGCSIDCNNPPTAGCITCNNVKYHFENSCFQCCQSDPCFGWECRNPDPCTYPIGTPFPDGCCELAVDPHTWVPEGDPCPSPPAGQYNLKTTCDQTTQCFKFYNDPTTPIDPPGGEPGGGGGAGAGGAPGTCLMYKCNGSTGDCDPSIVSKGSIPGLNANDPCPTTGTYFIAGNTYYASQSTCDNNDPLCCPKGTYWYCPGSPGQGCESEQLCPYQIGSDGKYNGFLMYNSEDGCNDSENCGGPAGPFCELYECRNGQCLPITKLVEDWAQIFGLNPATTTCTDIRLYLNSTPQLQYFTTSIKCQAVCGGPGDGGGNTGGGGSGDSGGPGDLDDTVFPDITIFDGGGSTGGGGGGSTGGGGGGNTGGPGDLDDTVFPDITIFDGGGSTGGGSTGGGGGGGDGTAGSTSRQGVFQSDPDKVKSVLSNIINEEVLVDPIATNRSYDTRTIKLALVDNNFRTDIFSNKIHYSVREAILQSRKESYTTSEVVYDDLSYSKIEYSLNEQLRDRLAKLHTLNGLPLKNQILKRLKFLIVNGRLDEFDIDDLEMLSNESQSIVPVTVAYEKRFINFLDNKLKPMDPKKYQGRGKELMRLWKTIAEDVDKSVILIDDGAIRELHPVKNNDTFDWLNSSGDASTMSIQDGDYIKTITSKGEELYVPLYTNLDKSFMLDLKETSEAFSMLRSSYEITLDVSSPESSFVEETYDLSNSREVAYYLKLDPNTIEDLPYERNVIRKTRVVYEIIDDDESMNDWSKFKPWPYFTLYIDPEDPFIDHLIESGKLTATYKDISFKRFIGYEDEYPNIPRRIPWYLVVVPTDRTSLLVSTGRSSLLSYNQRRIIYNIHPNSSRDKRKFSPKFMKVERANDQNGVNPNDSYIGPVYTVFNKELISNRKKLFKNNQQQLPRRKTNVRKLLESMRALRESGDEFLDEKNKIVSWGTLYKNLKIRERKGLSLFEFADWDSAKAEIENNSFAKEQSTKDRYTKVTIVPPRNIKKIDEYEDPVITVKKVKVDIDPETETPEEI